MFLTDNCMKQKQLHSLSQVLFFLIQYNTSSQRPETFLNSRFPSWKLLQLHAESFPKDESMSADVWIIKSPSTEKERRTLIMNEE